MIRIDSPAIYSSALGYLSRFKGHGYLGRLAQIFIAAKYYGRSFPVVGDSSGVDASSLQRMLDDFYERPSMGISRICMLFNDNHLPPTGVIGPGQTTPSNIWRNNFNIQKGFGCYAPDVDLQNPIFRNQSRKLCNYLLTASPRELSGASCSLNATGRYRSEDHAKVFKIDTTTREIFIYDPSDTAFYSQFLLNSAGRRIPLAPLVVALYHDSIAAAGRTSVDLSDFQTDFGFTPSEMTTYFDDDPVTIENAQIAAEFAGQVTWTRVSASSPLGGVRTPSPRAGGRTTSAANIAPPTGSFWWDAEQAVRLLLERDGWTVTDKSRLNLGYDLLGLRGGRTIKIEVKSSAGRCSPTLTPNEFAEACSSRGAYVLAIVEDFEPSRPASVKWVHDPARLLFTKRAVAAYSLPRSQWVPSAITTMP